MKIARGGGSCCIPRGTNTASIAISRHRMALGVGILQGARDAEASVSTTPGEPLILIGGTRAGKTSLHLGVCGVCRTLHPKCSRQDWLPSDHPMSDDEFYEARAARFSARKLPEGSTQPGQEQ